MTPDNYTTGVTRIITGGNNAELKVWDLVSVDDQTRYVSCPIETVKPRKIVFKIYYCVFMLLRPYSSYFSGFLIRLFWMCGLH